MPARSNSLRMGFALVLSLTLCSAASAAEFTESDAYNGVITQGSNGHYYSNDAANMLEQVDFAADDCVIKARGRKTQCKLADKTAKLLILQDKKDTSKYSMKLVVTKRGFESPVVGPIEVRMTEGDLDRTGQNANCTERNAKTVCK